MGATQLKLMIQPQEFFREKVTEAIANQRVDIGDEIEFYLVNLLCEFVSPVKLDTLNGELDALETPLAIILKHALEAPPMQKLRIYKYLGDTSLYLAGFFQDYFNRKAYDIDYYISLGSQAYDNVSSIMRDQHADRHFTAMYNDLARKFDNLVDVVAEVSQTPADQQKVVNILAVYDRWTRNNSERLRKLLEKSGIHPIPTSREKQ